LGCMQLRSSSQRHGRDVGCDHGRTGWIAAGSLRVQLLPATRNDSGTAGLYASDRASWPLPELATGCSPVCSVVPVDAAQGTCSTHTARGPLSFCGRVRPSCPPRPQAHTHAHATRPTHLHAKRRSQESVLHVLGQVRVVAQHVDDACRPRASTHTGQTHHTQRAAPRV